MKYAVQSAEVPERVRTAPRSRKYPFHDMTPGTMFFVPDAKPNTMISLTSATGRRLGWKFATRQLYMRIEAGEWVACDKTHKNAKLGVAVYRTE
jgi:hypothetical protein